MYTLCGELKNLPQQYISNLSPVCPPPLTGACNLSSTPALFPKTRTPKPRELLRPSTSAPPPLSYSRIHEFRVSIKPDSYSSGRGNSRRTDGDAQRAGTKKTTLSSLKLAGVAADGRDPSPSRCDSALLEIISSPPPLPSCPTPLLLSSLSPCGFSLSSRRYIYPGALRDKPSEFRLRR